MVVRPLLLLVPFCTVLGMAAAHAQAPADGLSAVNDAFGGTVRARIDERQRLVLDLFGENGRERQEVAPIAALDPASIMYSEAENAIVIGCMEDRRHCFAREDFKLNATYRGSRSLLPLPPDDPTGERTIAALRALLSMAGERLAEQRGATSGGR